MTYPPNDTHDPKLRSWVDSANDPSNDFPIQSLPLCFVAPPGHDGPADHIGLRIGDKILDLHRLAATVGLIDETPGDAQLFHRDQQDAFFAQSSEVWGNALRRRLQQLLRSDATADTRKIVERELYDVEACTLGRPNLRGYTDFYASVHHATNVGSMFRPDNPLLPNYKWIPVGYHGRASSVVLSGTPVTRPSGQQAPADEGKPPTFGPCKMLDYELEMGIVVGRGNAMGETIGINHAEDHILGLCLLNDWSARDIQKWEYQPLGPFLAKSFATTISPYIITMEALAPFRAPAYTRPKGDPQPLEHLASDDDSAGGAIDVTLEVYLLTAEMKQRDLAPHRLSKGSFKDMYWTPAQMLTHHASNGCNLQPGDLLGSGTVSGPKRDARGCLLELTWDGDPWANPPVKAPTTARTPIKLPSGESRRFLEDGDEVIIKGYCERDAYRRIGFGECRGVIQPANT
ncbi:MAG: fumarylacetoacetase [Phycisphaerae bacterium]|nr:fumarylacetoacetase [Phycisphaerae bacterium]